jgi:uncharacterized low-complexity protein
MKTALILSVVVGAILMSPAAQAKEVSETATVVTMNSVPCGSKVAHHKETRELLCHEYILRAGSTEYHVQQKEGKSSDLLTLGQQATFTINKDRMRLHATNTNGKAKDFEFVVVSMTAAEEANPPTAPQQ